MEKTQVDTYSNTEPGEKDHEVDWQKEIKRKAILADTKILESFALL